VFKVRRGGRNFALKLVPVGSDPGRAEREIDILRRLKLPSVVGFWGCGYWPDDSPHSIYVVMEHVDGPPLDEWVRTVKPTMRELVERLLPLVHALDKVHGANIVHRDIKTANILVRRRDGQVMLVDFGVGFVDGAPRLTPVLPPGTPEYRSPEAWRHAREGGGEAPFQAGPKEDLWGLGIVLYEILTGVLPFGAETSAGNGLVQAVLEKDLVPPHELNPRVPQSVSRISMRMLEKAPERRFPDAGALLKALGAALAKADDGWDVPLFGEPRLREVTGGERVAGGIAWWSRVLRMGVGNWVTVGGACAVVGVGLVASNSCHSSEVAAPSQPIASTDTITTEQAGFFHEVDPLLEPTHLEGGAAPWLAQTLAPVADATNPQELSVMPLLDKYVTTGLTTLCLTAAVSSAGCASTHPTMRPRPPRMKCPPGWEKMAKKLNLYNNPDVETIGENPLLDEDEKFIVGTDRAWPKNRRFIVMKEGPVKIAYPTEWDHPSPLPRRLEMHETPHPIWLTGRMLFGDGRAWFYMDRLHIRDGRSWPFCAVGIHPYGDPPFEEGSPIEEIAGPDSAVVVGLVGLYPGPLAPADLVPPESE
jgi:serine/threonine-protein kinase